MTTEEIAKRLVELMRAGDYKTCYDELFSPDIINIEPEGTPWGRVQGLEAIYKKGEEFDSMIDEIHSTEISDPICADNFIALTMKMKTTFKGSPEIQNMDEVCVYEVQNGKIVKEQFFYTPTPT